MSDLFDRLEHAAHRIREHFNQHPLWETIVQHLDDLISAGQALKAERATLLADRDAEKARADKAEGDLAALQSQVAADESKAASAAADLQAEVMAETPAIPVSVTVAAPTTAPSTTIPVSSTDGITAGATVSGAGTTPAGTTTVTAVDPVASTITVDTPTVADHVGDGTEQLVVTPAAN